MCVYLSRITAKTVRIKLFGQEETLSWTPWSKKICPRQPNFLYFQNRHAPQLLFYLFNWKNSPFLMTPVSFSMTTRSLILQELVDTKRRQSIVLVFWYFSSLKKFKNVFRFLFSTYTCLVCTLTDGFWKGIVLVGKFVYCVYQLACRVKPSPPAPSPSSLGNLWDSVTSYFSWKQIVAAKDHFSISTRSRADRQINTKIEK